MLAQLPTVFLRHLLLLEKASKRGSAVECARIKTTLFPFLQLLNAVESLFCITRTFLAGMVSTDMGALLKSDVLENAEFY